VRHASPGSFFGLRRRIFFHFKTRLARLPYPNIPTHALRLPTGRLVGHAPARCCCPGWLHRSCLAASSAPAALELVLAAVNGSRPPLDSADVDVDTVTQLYIRTDTLGLSTTYTVHGRRCRCRCARGPMSQSPAANHRSARPPPYTTSVHFSPSSSPATACLREPSHRERPH
jgi:hypothetical protein